MKNILITGGCGFIGSHFALELLKHNHNVIIIDNCINSSAKTAKIIEKISSKKIKFYQNDILEKSIFDEIFKKNEIECVAHFAGLKNYNESYSNSSEYYSTNVVGSLNLLEAMKKNKVKRILFPSSATVYGNKFKPPWKEDMNLEFPDNPYAQTKIIVENILKKILIEDPGWRIAILRYFNPIGAHKSGLMGESYSTYSKNLIPSISRVLTGNEKYLRVYGNTFNTKDGTGERDYLHINDLILAHLKTINYIKRNKGLNIWNLGAGVTHSVMNIINEFENVTKQKIPYKIVDKRHGELSQYWADIAKAKKDLNWQIKNDLNSMIRDIWKYIENN